MVFDAAMPHLHSSLTHNSVNRVEVYVCRIRCCIDYNVVLVGVLQSAACSVLHATSGHGRATLAERVVRQSKGLM